MKLCAVVTADTEEIVGGELGSLLATLDGQVDAVILVWRRRPGDVLTCHLPAAVEVVPVPPAGVSAARNAGIEYGRHRQTTEWLWGFPDDDCTWPAGLRAALIPLFRAGWPWACLPYGPSQGGVDRSRFPVVGQEVRPTDALQLVASAGLFIRGDVLGALGGFDETLGVGTSRHSGEEVDLVLRALRHGHIGRYVPQPAVEHAYGGTERIERVAGRLAVLRAHGRWSPAIRARLLVALLSQARALLLQNGRGLRLSAIRAGLSRPEQARTPMRMGGAR